MENYFVSRERFFLFSGIPVRLCLGYNTDMLYYNTTYIMLLPRTTSTVARAYGHGALPLAR